MGTLEERIVADLEALCEADPGCGRHMMVFPVGLMVGRSVAGEGELAVVRRGEVAMVCRPEGGSALHVGTDLA